VLTAPAACDVAFAFTQSHAALRTDLVLLRAGTILLVCKYGMLAMHMLGIQAKQNFLHVVVLWHLAS